MQFNTRELLLLVTAVALFCGSAAVLRVLVAGRVKAIPTRVIQSSRGGQTVAATFAPRRMWLDDNAASTTVVGTYGYNGTLATDCK